jgi:hypothetical protein
MSAYKNAPSPYSDIKAMLPGGINVTVVIRGEQRVQLTSEEVKCPMPNGDGSSLLEDGMAWSQSQAVHHSRKVNRVEP